MYYSAAVVGINTSAFIEAAVVGKPVHTVLLPGDLRRQPGRHAALPLPARRSTAGCCARRARSTSTCRCWPTSLAGHGGGDAKAARFVDGFVRPFGRDEAATPRFVDAVERGRRRCRRRRRERRGRAAAGWRISLLFPLACRARAAPAHAAVAQADAQPAAQAVRASKLPLSCGGSSSSSTDHFIASGKRRKVGDAGRRLGADAEGRPSARPGEDAGRHRVRARRSETRELVTVLGRSGRPIILGPWLSETGFELLYWIPFLAWAKAYGNFDPERLVVVSRGGAAPWYRHITPHYEEIFSFYTPDEFRVAQRAPHRRAAGPAEAHRDLVVRPRDPRARAGASAGSRAPRCCIPSQMYQLFDHFWFQRDAGDAGRGVHRRSRPIPAAAAVRHPSRSFPSATSRRSSTATSALPPTPENRAFVTGYLADLAQHVDVVLLNTAQRSTITRTFRRSCAAACTRSTT